MKYDTHGTMLKMSDGGATPVFATVAQAVSMALTGLSRGNQDVFTHDNVSGVADRIHAALATAGQLALTLAWDPANATHDQTTGILDVAQSGEERDFQLIFPDSGATQFDFAAVVSDFSFPGLDANTGLLTMEVTLSLSGAFTVV